MYVTKQLSKEDLRAKLDASGLVEHRPGLALLVLRGEIPYTERTASGEERGYALEDSPAARSNETPVAEPAARDLSDAELQKRLDDIQARAAGSASPLALEPRRGFLRSEEKSVIIQSNAPPAVAVDPTDASAELVKLCGAQPHALAPTPSGAPHASDAGAELVQLALADVDASPTDHLFPEPPTAA